MINIFDPELREFFRFFVFGYLLNIVFYVRNNVCPRKTNYRLHMQNRLQFRDRHLPRPCSRLSHILIF